MATLRKSGRRLLVCLVATSLVITLLVIRALHSRSDVETLSSFGKFVPRAVFLGEKIPGKRPVIVNTEQEFVKLYLSSSDKRSGKSSENSLIYLSHDDGSPNENHKRWQIPKIFHQTWPTSQIPTSLSPFIKSVMAQNPDYEYWFWSDKDGLELIKKRFPQYLDIYTQYTKPIHRADAIRYFILYEFGGFYADVDIAVIKSLDPLRRHSCIVSQEPWVHAKVYWGWDHLMPCNAFMAAAPKHPLMKKLVETIPRNYYGNDKNDVMNKTGPMMLERILKEYDKERGNNHTDFDRVYLAEPNLFHPRYDPNLRARYIQGCENPARYRLSSSEVEECLEAKARRYMFKMPPEAYTDHHWVHYWIGGSFVRKINPSNNVNIKQIIPGVRNVTHVLQTP